MNEPITMEQVRGELKKTHETFMAEVKRFKDPVHQTSEKVEKLQTALDEQVKRLDEMIVKINRPALPVAGSAEAKKLQREMLRKALRLGFDAKTGMIDLEKALTPEEIKALSVSVDPAGGYLAPVEYANEIIQSAVEFSPVREYARVFTTTRQSLRIPRRTQRPGVTKHQENVADGENQNLAYGLVEVPTKEYKSVQRVSNELIEDTAYNIEEQLQMDVSFEFGVSEGRDFILGNGASEPEGIVSSGYFSTVNTITNDVFAAEDVIQLFYDVKEAYAMRGVFMAHRSIIREVRKFKSTTGEFLWQPGLNGDASQTLMGKPIREAVDMASAVADQAKIMLFGDFRRAYGIVDRIGINVLRDPYSRSLEGEVQYIFRKRTGAKGMDPEALRILKVQ